jgi:hypothetical protein
LNARRFSSPVRPSVSAWGAEQVALTGGVERERDDNPEALDDQRLVLGERHVIALAVDVEHRDRAPRDLQRHAHHRLGLDRRAHNQSAIGIEVAARNVARMAIAQRRAGDPLSEREAIRHHLLGVAAVGKQRDEHPGRPIDLIEREIVVWHQPAESLRNAAERLLERVGRQHRGRGVHQRVQRRGPHLSRNSVSAHQPYGYRHARAGLDSSDQTTSWTTACCRAGTGSTFIRCRTSTSLERPSSARTAPDLNGATGR